MPYLPYMSDYKPFYIQAANDATAWSTGVYGLVAKSSPYPAFPELKDPYNNDWKDENGDDEYLTSVNYKAFTFDVQFYVKAFDTVNGQGVVTKTADVVLREQMADFFAKIKVGEFKVFDSYTGLGRQKVRYAGYSENSGFLARDNWARLIFKVTFKVNDPVTNMKLQGGSIVSV